MTATTAMPPVFLHTLADRNGVPSALLLDASGLQVDMMPASVLQELASGSMSCYYRFRLGAGQADAKAEAVHQLLDEAGWKALPADKVHHSDIPLAAELPTNVGSSAASGISLW